MPIGSFRSGVGWEMAVKFKVTDGKKTADTWYVSPGEWKMTFSSS